MSQFNGFRVLELASVLAGPSVGQFFAELGAEVIKVENLKAGGDVTRTWKLSGEKTDDRSAYFTSVNWGKKSIAVDLGSKAGQKIIHDLAAKSDIVIASYKPGDAEKLNVDHLTLRKINPSLIYGQITGYGSHSPRVGYDAIIQAEAGFMYMNGEPGGSSLKMPVALIDVLAGHHLKEGILLAMLEKMKTGKGKLVEVSLIQAAIASLVNQATNWLVAKKLPQKHGSAHPNIAPYGDVFLTSDRKELLVAIGNDRQFEDLCNILEIGYLATHENFKTNSLRVINRDSLNSILSDAISKRESHKLLTEINARKIPAGLIQNMKDVFELPEAKQMIIENDDFPGVKTFAVSPELVKSSHFLPPPHFGEHTVIVLKESLKYSTENVENLLREGIIR